MNQAFQTSSNGGTTEVSPWEGDVFLGGGRLSAQAQSNQFKNYRKHGF